MSKNITAAQLDANQSIYKIDDYRKMVNYESGTNKGYVRFTTASDGKLKIEKFNNKIDVPLSWRSNVSAAHNKSVRAKFLSAIESDLRFMGEAGEKIKDMILRPKNANGQIEAGKALSRRELKAIFEKFDSEFNNGFGRMKIVENFFKDAMARCGFIGSKDDFIAKYLKPSMKGIDITKQLYFETDEANAANPDPTKRMKMGETEFRAYLVQLDNLVATAKLRVDAEKACKDVARGIAANAANFGGEVPEADVGKVRAALKGILKDEGVEAVDLGFGTAGSTLELFISNVLPVMVRQAAENIRDFADNNNPASVEEVLEGDLSIDKIVDAAKRFIEGANKVLDEKVEVPQDRDEIDRKMNAVKATIAFQQATQKRLAVFGAAREAIVYNVNLKQAEGGKALAQGVVALTETYIKEANLANYTTKFLLDNYAKGASDLPQHEANFEQKAKEHINQLVVAGQLNYGERWATGVIPGMNIPQLKAGGNVQKFLKAMSDGAIDIANEERGGLPMVDNLLKRTVPNILNQKIGNSLASKGAMRLHIDEASYPDALNAMRLAAKAYKKFFHDSEQLLVGKALTSFRTQLDRLLKKGNITADEYNTLYADYKTRIDSALSRAVERFYGKTPLAKSESDDKAIKAGAKILETLFSEEKDAVTSEMRQRISSIALANAYGGEERRKLLDVKAHVDACRDSLAQAGVKLTADFGDGELTVALNKLYWKVLEKKIEGKKLGHHQIGTNFNDSVQSAFVSAAKDLVNGVNGLCTKLDERLRVYMEDALNAALKPETMETYKKEFGKDGVKTLAKSVADGVLLSYKGKTDEIKRNFLANPETYTKKSANVEKIVLSFFDLPGIDKLYSKENVSYVFESVLDERTFAVLSWIYNPTGPEGKSTLAADLAAGEKTRVLADDSKVKNYASAMPANELANIVNQAVKEVLAHAEKFAIMYATGGRKEFMERINKEIQAIVDKHVESHAKFREAFVKDALPILEKYDDALRTETHRGKDVATAKMNEVLNAISRDKEPPKVKGFATAFDGMLKKMLEDKVDMEVSEFMVYSKKVTDAYEKCMPAFEAKIREMHGKLKEAGATDDDIRHLEEKLMPVLRQDMETQILNHLDDYTRKDIAVPLAENWADTQVNAMVHKLNDMNLTTHIGLLMVFNDIGMKELLTGSDAVENATKEALATALKSPDAQKIVADARKAAMTEVAYGANTTSAEPKAATEAQEAFRRFVRDTVLGVQKSVLEGEFNETQVEPAVKLFELWLEKYNLPDIHVSSEDIKQGTLKDAAVAHFKKRVVALQQEISEKGRASEPLLSANYIKGFVTYLNRIGRKAMYTAMESDLVSKRTKEIMASKSYLAAYELPPEGDDGLRDIVFLNVTGLQEHLVAAMKRAEAVLSNTVVSLEDMHRWSELITNEMDKQIADTGAVLDQYHQFAHSRSEMIGTIDLEFVSGDYAIDQYLGDALKDHFGGMDISDVKVVTPEFMKKHKTTVTDMVNHLKGIVKAGIDKQKAMLKAEATNNPKLGEIHFRFPGTKQLEVMFRDVADSAVEAIAGQKKGDYVSFFHAVEKEVKKAAKGAK